MDRTRRRRWSELDELFAPGVSRDYPNSRVGQVEEVQPEREEIASEEENYRDLLQKVKADFINYKRRVERDREEQTKSANRELIVKLLPTIDDLERALRSVPGEIADGDWVEGIGLIHRKLMAVLGEEGLTRIDAEDREFDPWEHEAVFCEDCSDSGEAKVKTVLREGYRLYDKVIRPSQVVVSKGEDITDEVAMDSDSE